MQRDDAARAERFAEGMVVGRARSAGSGQGMNVVLRNPRREVQVAGTRHLAITAGVVTVAFVLAVTFVLGRRRGKRLTTIVEIRRV